MEANFGVHKVLEVRDILEWKGPNLSPELCDDIRIYEPLPMFLVHPQDI